jgi:hypothetical protein
MAGEHTRPVASEHTQHVLGEHTDSSGEAAAEGTSNSLGGTGTCSWGPRGDSPI